MKTNLLIVYFRETELDRQWQDLIFSSLIVLTQSWFVDDQIRKYIEVIGYTH